MLWSAIISFHRGTIIHQRYRCISPNGLEKSGIPFVHLISEEAKEENHIHKARSWLLNSDRNEGGSKEQGKLYKHLSSSDRIIARSCC